MAGGSHTKDASPVKSVLNTNFDVHTGKKGFLSNPLNKRLLLNPFANPIDDCDDPEILEFEEKYLSSEIMAIINKALKEFSPVYNDPFHQWAVNYEVNSCVEAESEEESIIQPQSGGINPDAVLKFFITSRYEIADEINPEVRADIIFEDVNAVFKGLVSNTAWLGRKLNNIFGNELHAQHTSRGIEYNLIKK